jgi:hypothetical protein
MNEEIDRTKIIEVAKLLGFTELPNGYLESACDKLLKETLIEVLIKANFKETSCDWYARNIESINVNNLVKILEIYNKVKR